MPSWEPIPAYATLCKTFREANNSKACTWNIITTVWDARGIQAQKGNGTNDMVISVEHLGVRDNSKVFEKSINEIPNRVFKHEYTGQPYTFFASCLNISVYHQGLLPLGMLDKPVGQCQIGIMDVFLSANHMLPIQWFPIVDPNSDLPAEPLGYLRLNCIINTLHEPGAVQSRAPDDVASWELNRHEIMQIPRLNLRVCASHQYNLKFMVYQGFDLGRGGFGPAGDPQFRVITPCGIIATDPFPNSLDPKWNAMLQIPFYEPTFTDLIICEVRDALGTIHSRMYLSWKDLYINQEANKSPRWIDMYEREAESAGFMDVLGLGQAKGYEERSIYCGRVLLSMEIEERSPAKEPSPANIALKPKDTEILWSDPKQKMFFRFHTFYGQSFGSASAVMVEFSVGRKSVLSGAAKKGDKGLYEFFRSMELELDLPFDDTRDNPDGDMKANLWDPQYFISKLPDCIIKVYEVGLMGKGPMIGMWQGPVQQMLGGGDPEYYADNVYVGMYKDDNGTGGRFEGVASVMIAPGDEAPEPSKKTPWGRENDLLTQRIMNPYTGYQYVALKSDATCSLGPTDVAGFIGFSAKLWLATREKCGNQPPKGPPILSPWTMWNHWLIPAPWSDSLQWLRFFTIKGHIYQAKDLPSHNETGVANASVDLSYLVKSSPRTSTVYFTNQPTFDQTILLSDIEVYLLPDDWKDGADEYIPDPEDFTDVEKNKAMLKLAPMIEASVWEGSGSDAQLIGRTFISPPDTFARKQNPTFIPLYRSNPDVVEGHLLASFQMIESTEKLMKEPPVPLVPDKSWVNPADPDTWCSKAPVREIPMMECKIQIQVLGLRDFSSPYLFDRAILQPQVEVCCDDPTTARTTKATSRPSGQDANFLEVVEIDVQMPEDKIFAPSLDFYFYDHSVMGFAGPVDLVGVPIVGYATMAMGSFYPSDSEVVDDDEDIDEEDEEAMEKKRQKDRKKLFDEAMKDLKKSGVLRSAKDAKALEVFFMKKDEAVVSAFEQYADAPDAAMFIKRVQSFLLPSNLKQATGKDAPKQAKAKQEKGSSKSKQAGKADAGEDGPSTTATDLVDAPASRDNAGVGGVGPGDAVGSREVGGGGGLDEADAGDDEGEEGDGQDEEEAEEVFAGEAVEGEADELPDQQEKVDTPDGKPNAEWLLLRSHPLYDCELEKSTVREYGKKGAWEPRFSNIFDEVQIFRGPIKNSKQKDSEGVGILKCKVKLFKKESEEAAELRGEDQRYLDMQELKRNKEVEYQIPDVNENYPARDVVVRVYLLKAFQMSPCTIVDGVTQSNCIVELQLGGPHPAKRWKWTDFYDPVKSLNPHFYRCAEVVAKLPGPSQLHVCLYDDIQFMGILSLEPLFGLKKIGETVIDLEDRWFCEEWAQKTVHKPRETRDLFNPERPGISVGKMMVMMDMVMRVDAEDKPAKDVNIAGRQMPLEMRLIVWNLRNCAPKDGYTSDIKVVSDLLGWGKVKETDTDAGVKVSRNAMFNFRIKFKGIKFPSPDPTVPAKDFVLKISVWHQDFLTGLIEHSIAEGLLPLQPLFLDCMQRNLGKPSPDDMEIVTLPPDKDGDVEADEEGTKYPFKWFKLNHPGGPGCKTNKNFKQPGYDFEKNCQAEIQITIQVMPRAKARAMPASNGFKAGPAKLKDPNRPPQPTNPIFNPEGCKAYIVYTCAEAINKKKPCCCCLSCCVIIVALLVGYVYLLQAGLAPKLPFF